jgi:three-Cys-motif partner protein
MPSARKPNSEWLKSKLDKLVEMTEIVKKECPTEYSEADPEYGFWSIKKEIALMYWIWPFLQIANKYFASFYYIDLFAGSGLMKADNDFFVGSPIVAVSSTLRDKKFDHYICFELDESRKVALERRMTVVCNHFETYGAMVFFADCNMKIESVLKEHCPPDNTCFLAFIDPQKITDLKWKTIQSLLVHGKGDIILNFPTMAINRNLEIPESAKSLTEFIGDDEWQGIKTDIDAVIEHFKGNISKYRSQVDSLTVKDEQNRRLYDLIFATNSLGMKNALDDLKKRLNQIKTRDIRGLYAVVAEGQKQLKDYWPNS